MYDLAVGEERELFFLLLITLNFVDSVQSGFLFRLVLRTACVVLLWNFLGFPHNYLDYNFLS